MSDDVTIDNGSGTDYDVATDDDGSGNHVQIVKLAYSADGGRTPIPADADGLLVNLGANNDVTVTGTVTATASGDHTVVGKAADGAAVSGNPVLIAGQDGTNVQSIKTDSSGELQVDVLTMPSTAVTNAGTFAVQADTELTTADLDTGGGTDTRAVVGLAGTASGGAQLIPGSSTDGLLVNLGANNDVTVTGTVTVGSHAVTNAGTFATQVDGSALTALQKIDDPVLVDDAGFTPASSSVMMAGFEADEASIDSVDEGDAGAARMTLDRKQIVTVQPHTAGGWDIKMCSSGDGSTALTNSAQAVKASAGKLGGWYIYNPNSSATYVIIYNTASGSVTVGTTNPVMVLCIPATSAANLEMVNGVTFDTAIAVAATTTGPGNTAPTTALEANFFYK